MNLEQIAQQAMDYLDSVGVAAEYEIAHMNLKIFTDEHVFICVCDDSFIYFMSDISYTYPQKSPAK